MYVQTFSDPARFLAVAGPWLGARLAENSLLLGVATRSRDVPGIHCDAPWFALARDGDRPVLAALRTAPRPLLLSRGAASAAGLLAEAVTRYQPDNPGVIGPRDEAAAFAESWRPGAWRQEMAMRAYQLAEVSPDPRRPSGELRQPHPQERGLLERWIVGFRRDAHLRDAEPASEVADRMIAGTRAFFFAVGGRPVALVAGAVDLPEAARIGMVYTPPELRGRGFGSAATAALSQLLLDRGSRACLLFTDLANPTSNSVYIQVGYRPVCDYLDLAFE